MCVLLYGTNSNRQLRDTSHDLSSGSLPHSLKFHGGKESYLILINIKSLTHNIEHEHPIKNNGFNQKIFFVALFFYVAVITICHTCIYLFLIY